jgi:hypothetical protein
VGAGSEQLGNNWENPRPEISLTHPVKDWVMNRGTGLLRAKQAVVRASYVVKARQELRIYWNNSAGSMKHCFQNESFDRRPACHCAKLEIVAETCPPSAESKTITTPAGGCSAEDSS